MLVGHEFATDPRSPGYKGYKAQFGKEQAMNILQNEMDTLNLVEEIVKKEGIDCDFWRGLSYGAVSIPPHNIRR